MEKQPHSDKQSHIRQTYFRLHNVKIFLFYVLRIVLWIVLLDLERRKVTLSQIHTYTHTLNRCHTHGKQKFIAISVFGS